jgi:hypothetical protein
MSEMATYYKTRFEDEKCSNADLVDAIQSMLWYSKTVEELQFALENGADVTKFPLILNREWDTDCISMLIAAGACVDRQSSLGFMPIHHANTPESIQLFIEARCDLETQTDEGYTVLDLCMNEGLWTCVDFLLRSGALPSSNDEK